MSRFDEGLKIIEECCGNGKDNIIALSTIAVDESIDGNPRPCVREVDAYYAEGVFYVTTWGKSNKIKQVENNKEVAFVVSSEGISGTGVGENLGWVLKPENSAIRAKLREVFCDWYDQANNEQNENCVILAIRIVEGNIFRDHGAVQYNLDFVKKLDVK